MTFDDGRLGLPSASKAERWTNCVGSVQLEELIPDTETGPEAKRGDRIHFALADGKVNDLPHADEVECAELLQEMEKKAVEAFRIEVKAVDEAFSGKLTASREQRLVLKRGETPLMTGKPDLVLWTEDSIVKRGLIVDYKTGMGIVPTEKSHQLRVLAFLAADEYGLDEVYVTILQPNNPIVLQKMTRSEIRLERERALLALDRISDKSAIRLVGPWCQYCKATGICPEAQEATKTLTTTTSAVIEISQIPKLLEVCTLAESVIENVRKRAREILDAGGEIPGWKLINSKRRSITSSASAYHLIKEAFGEEVAMGSSTVSLTEATRSLASKAGLKEKEAKSKIESVLADIIEMKNSQRLMRS